MYLILVIYLVNRIVSAQDSSDETKYIDLLPDKEKEEFLERIARRVFDEVQSKDDRDRVSGEVSETQLDEHDDFVKQILEEETSNLRKSSVDLVDKKSDDDNKRDEDDVNEQILEKEDIHDTVDDAKLIDLTLYAGKRNKRNSFAKTQENSKIIHVSTGNAKTNVRNNKDDAENADSTQDKSGLKAEDIQIKYFRRNSLKNTNELEVTTQSSSNIQINDFAETVKFDSEATPPENNVHGSSKDSNESQETKYQLVNEEENIEIINNNENTKNINFGTTQKSYESLEKEGNGRHSEEMTTVPEAIESTTMSESMSPDVKPTVVPTIEILSDKNHPAHNHKNKKPSARSLKYTVSVTLDDKKLDKGNITGEYKKDNAKEDVHTTVSSETVNDSEPGTDQNEEIAKGLEKINYDVITTDSTTTRTSYIEHATIKNEGSSTSLKAEGLTTVSLRTESEERVGKERNMEEPLAGKKENFEQSQIKTNKTEHSSIELIGGKVNDNIKKNVQEDKEISKSKKFSTIGDKSATKIKKTLTDTQIKGIPSELDKQSNSLANDMIKVLRAGITLDSDTDDNNLNGLRALYEATNPKQYKVYEVVSAGKQPFLEKNQLDITNKENPHYVPIYNYSPENAYYNPHNHLGPNADDDNETIINQKISDDKNENIDETEKEDIDFEDENNGHDTNYRESKEQTELKNYASNRDNVIESLIRKLKNYKNQRKFRFGDKKKSNKTPTYKFNMPMVVEYPKFTDIILNPNDYLDVDYLYGRTLETPPNIRSRCDLDEKDNIDSSEDHHLSNNLKNQMSSARQFLYNQKLFGYIASYDERTKSPLNITESGEENVKTAKEVLRSGSATNTKDSKHLNDKNIAMDYFFGRNAVTKTRTNELPYSKYSNKDSNVHKNKNKPKGKIYRSRMDYSVNEKVPKSLPYKSLRNDVIRPATPTYSVDVGPQFYNPPERMDKTYKSLNRKGYFFYDEYHKRYDFKKHDRIRSHKGRKPKNIEPQNEQSHSIIIGPPLFHPPTPIGKNNKNAMIIKIGKKYENRKPGQATKTKIKIGPPLFHPPTPIGKNNKNGMITKVDKKFENRKPGQATQTKINIGPPLFLPRQINKKNKNPLKRFRPQYKPKKSKPKESKPKKTEPKETKPKDIEGPKLRPEFTVNVEVVIPVSPEPELLALRAKKEEDATDFETIKKVLSIADSNDLLITLDKLLKLDLTARTRDKVDLEAYVTVLEDLVRNDAKGLKQYDWLTTTVDVQSALVKLMDMTEELENNITISQPDLQLLKYTIYLHKSTKELGQKHYRKNKLLPRNKRKRKGIITESGLLSRNWLVRMMSIKYDTIITKEDLNDFDKFLNELQYYLYDLHTAIQQIANITTYNSQRWYENLKEVYVNTKRKTLLEILLHITTTRLLDLIELSAKNGAQEDFLTFVLKNDKEVERAKTEFAFVLKIVDELKFENDNAD